MAGVLIQDKVFTALEFAMSTICQMLIPPERLEQFTEFHACELYGGYGVFEGIDEGKRHEAVRHLLGLLNGGGGLPVVYGAVNLEALKNKLYATADPMDMCFRICTKGIQNWVMGGIMADSGLLHMKPEELEMNLALAETSCKVLAAGLMERLVLLIVDDCDKRIKESLQRSFRSMRPARRYPPIPFPSTLFHFHDDMYFGDSRFSIGIQLADLCSYLVGRHLEGDKESEEFYKTVEPHICYSEIQPEDEHGQLSMAPQLQSLPTGNKPK